MSPVVAVIPDWPITVPAAATMLPVVASIPPPADVTLPVSASTLNVSLVVPGFKI